jgi:hypothetical protein
MLTNIDLEQMCHHYSVPLYFCGMKNELPSKVRDGNYIINLDSSTHSSGTHWTALVIDGNQAAFFDSFGALPSKQVIDFCKKRHNLRLTYNNWIIQDLQSENCGSFCLSLLLYLRKHPEKSLFRAFNTFINGYSGNTKENDSILASFFKEYNGMGKIPKQIRRLIERVEGKRG